MKILFAFWMLVLTVACNETSVKPCLVFVNNGYTDYQSGDIVHRIPTLSSHQNNGYIWWSKTKLVIPMLSCEMAAIIGERIYEPNPLKRQRDALTGWKIEVWDTNGRRVETSTRPHADQPSVGSRLEISSPSSEEIVSIPIDSNKPGYIQTRFVE